MAEIQQQRNDRLFGLYEYLPMLAAGLTYVGLALLIVSEFTERAFGTALVPTVELKLKLVAAVVIAGASSLQLRLGAIGSDLKLLVQGRESTVRVLASGDAIDVPELLTRSRRVRVLTLAGTRVGRLGDAEVLEALRNPQRASHLTLLLANPRSPSVISRYSKDEPATFESGIEGLTRRLFMLHELIEKLPKDAASRIEVRVYDNYPTVSIVQSDDKVYSSVYGFQLRGSDCPLLCTEPSTTWGVFLGNHFDKVFEAATKLSAWVENANHTDNGHRQV